MAPPAAVYTVLPNATPYRLEYQITFPGDPASQSYLRANVDLLADMTFGPLRQLFEQPQPDAQAQARARARTRVTQQLTNLGMPVAPAVTNFLSLDGSNLPILATTFASAVALGVLVVIEFRHSAER